MQKKYAEWDFDDDFTYVNIKRLLAWLQKLHVPDADAGSGAP